jgi:hypothetical protein
MATDIAYPYIEQEILEEVEVNGEMVLKETPAIPLEDIKKYLKLSDCNISVDTELETMCKTALEYAEKYSRTIFKKKRIITNRIFWGEFRNGVLQNYYTLRRSPVVDIESIKYDDDNVLSENHYKLVKRGIGNFDVLQLKDTATEKLPEVKNDWFPIEITYTAGFDKIPTDIKQAMLSHIASMWLNRGDYDNNNLKCPQMARDIYKKYKVIEVGT